MLEVLQAEGSEVLGLLRLIGNDVAALNKILNHPDGIGAGVAAVGGFPKKKELYHQAARRMTPRQLVALNQLSLKVDLAVKGQSKTPAWLVLNQLALTLAGAQVPH